MERVLGGSRALVSPRYRYSSLILPASTTALRTTQRLTLLSLKSLVPSRGSWRRGSAVVEHERSACGGAAGVAAFGRPHHGILENAAVGDGGAGAQLGESQQLAAGSGGIGISISSAKPSSLSDAAAALAAGGGPALMRVMMEDA